MTRVTCSKYLSTVFPNDEKALWLANMVTHYRHDHRAWDRQYSYVSARYGQEAYDRQKAVINEQAKRQIIRKCYKFLLGNSFTVKHFMKLKSDEKTLQLAAKYLPTD